MQIKPTFISYVDPSSQSFRASDGDAVSGSRQVSWAATDPASARLARRNEPSRASKALKDFGCWLARPFNALSRGLGKAVQPTPHAGAMQGAGAIPPLLSCEQIRQNNPQLFIEEGLRGASQAKALLNISAAELERGHAELAIGNGALRRVVSGLKALDICPPDLARRAAELGARDVGGLGFSQWATTDREASRLARLPEPPHSESAAVAAQAHLEQAAAGIRELAADVLLLVRDVEAYLAGSPPAFAASTGKVSPAESSKEREFSALFDRLEQSPQVQHDASTINLGHSQIALVLKAMREGSISPDRLAQQISTGAELELMRSLYSIRALKAPGLEAALSELGAQKGTGETALGNFSVALTQFVRAAGREWAAGFVPAPTERLGLNSPNPPEVLRSRMIGQVREQLQALDRGTAQRILEQLQGPLGKGVQVVLKAVLQQARTLTQGAGVPPSLSYLRADALVASMIGILRERLEESSPRRLPPSLENAPLPILAPQELVALARVMCEEPSLVH